MRTVILLLFVMCSSSTLFAAGKGKGYYPTASPACTCPVCKPHRKHHQRLAPEAPRAAIVGSVAIRQVARPRTRSDERDIDRIEELERELDLVREQLEAATKLILQLSIQQAQGCGKAPVLNFQPQQQAQEQESPQEPQIPTPPPSDPGDEDGGAY